MTFKALYAEFLGVFALCFVAIFAGRHLGIGSAGLLGSAFASGLVIAVMVGAFIGVSGAHFNPAVSFGLWLMRRINGRTMLAYWFVQFLGGGLGALAVFGMTGADGVSVVLGGTPAVGYGYPVWSAAVGEAVGTFFLMTVIYATAVDRRGALAWAPLFIGLVIVVVILAVGPVSGAALNPARFLGPAVVGRGLNGDFWVWFVGPMVGAGLAAVIYENVLLRDLTDEA